MTQVVTTVYVYEYAKWCTCLKIMVTYCCVPLYAILSCSMTPDSRDELGGVLGLMLACLLKCSADVRSLVANNLVLTGGGAQLPGAFLCYLSLRLCGVCLLCVLSVCLNLM